MAERWRNVRRAAGYQVSSLGRVRSPGGVLTPQDHRGRMRIKIRGEWVPVAHLVLEAFDRPRPYGLEACHGPGGYRVNTPENLRWDTHGENISDKRRHAKAGSEGGTYQVRPKPVETAGLQ